MARKHGKHVGSTSRSALMVNGAERVERKFALSREAAQRLDVHAVGTGRRQAAILEDLILTHLRRFHLTDRGGSAGSAQPAILGVVGEGRGEDAA
jgi:hypothetical protein